MHVVGLGRRAESRHHDLAQKRLVEPRRAEPEAQLLGICIRYLLFKDFDDDSRKLLSKGDEEIQMLANIPQGDGLFGDDDIGMPEGDADTTKTAEPRYYSPSASGFGEFFVYASCYWLEHFQAVPSEL